MNVNDEEILQNGEEENQNENGSSKEKKSAKFWFSFSPFWRISSSLTFIFTQYFNYDMVLGVISYTFVKI